MCSAARRQQARMQAPRLSVHLSLVYLACAYTFRGGMWSRAYICVYSSFLAGWVSLLEVQLVSSCTPRSCRSLVVHRVDLMISSACDFHVCPC